VTGGESKRDRTEGLEKRAAVTRGVLGEVTVIDGKAKIRQQWSESREQ
jgi:hypothetical protein